MSHSCRALILHCLDFRLGPAIKKYLEDEKLLGDCDIVSVAGAVKNLVEPAAPTDQEFILRQIDISKKLHGLTEIILMNHTDCGAYGGRAVFISDEAEKYKHGADLKQACDLLRLRYSDLTMKLALAVIQPRGEVVIEDVQ